MRRFAIAAVCGAALAACSPQAPKPAATESAAPSAARSSLPLHITGQGTAKQPVRFFFQRDHNRVEYELTGSSYESKGPQGKTRAVVQNAKVTFHEKDGSTMAATAPQAIIDENTSSVTLVNGVHATTSSGMTLQCQTLTYDRVTAMLHGNGNVVIVDPKGFRGTGSSFDSDISLTHMQMR